MPNNGSWDYPFIHTTPKDVQAFDQARAEKEDLRQEKFFFKIIIWAAYTLSKIFVAWLGFYFL